MPSIDISNEQIAIKLSIFQNMLGRYFAYQKANKIPPAKIYLNPKKTGEYITGTKLREMYVRYDAWKKAHKQMPPASVWIVKPKAAPVAPAIKKPDVVLKLEAALGGTFNNATQMYQLFIDEIYGYYYNDRYDQQQELDRLKRNLGINCSDVSQVGYAGILALNQMGKYYEVRFVRATFKCGGHVFLQVKGEEFGDKWTNYDLAGAMKWDYPIGKLMCSGEYWDSVVNPKWLLTDDGKV